jgi:hypothetical protein
MRPLGIIIAALLITSELAVAQPRSTTGAPFDVSVRVNGPVYVEAGDFSPSLLVINSNAIVAGHVEGAVVVINGTAEISGTVDRDVVVVNGRALLADAARVSGSVQLFGSELTRAAGATVQNGVHEQGAVTIVPPSAFAVWLGVTVLLLIAGVLLAAIARRPVNASAALFAREPFAVVATGVVVAAALPILAMTAFVTVIGIPLALAIALYLIPALIFTGCVITGAAVGHYVIKRLEWSALLPDTPRETAIATAIGLGILQVIALVPAVGSLIVVFASMAGAGALACRIWMRTEARHA